MSSLAIGQMVILFLAGALVVIIPCCVLLLDFRPRHIAQEKLLRTLRDELWNAEVAQSKVMPAVEREEARRAWLSRVGTLVRKGSVGR